MAGIEGQVSSLEVQRPNLPSPYVGRFLYADEVVARSSTISELESIKTFLTKAQHAWKTNSVENIVSGDVLILTTDRWKPLNDQKFHALIQHLELKIQVISEQRATTPSAPGDYQLSSFKLNGLT